VGALYRALPALCPQEHEVKAPKLTTQNLAALQRSVRDKAFLRKCERMKLGPVIQEYVFAPPRKWRFDFAWPASRIALEVDGGVWVSGRHTRGAGWLKDAEKMNEAAAMGWRVLHITPQQMTEARTFQWIQRARTWIVLDVFKEESRDA
jgi:very-short-patch-repair endonuclease